ncbi:hypothetical protein IWQ60_005267 [Tieghemiomyces parasiticus]|uniref:Uncharacterized protein n=1 Tax=Tieghemiomyces parasiticus TaxID=78921 RepID=A0A9W8A7A2_9FUNG|nr:hypothetical protein IWQ60_005267 [Tieghemiomyces parasiticus]
MNYINGLDNSAVARMTVSQAGSGVLVISQEDLFCQLQSSAQEVNPINPVNQGTFAYDAKKVIYALEAVYSEVDYRTKRHEDAWFGQVYNTYDALVPIELIQLILVHFKDYLKVSPADSVGDGEPIFFITSEEMMKYLKVAGQSLNNYQSKHLCSPGNEPNSNGGSNEGMSRDTQAGVSDSRNTNAQSMVTSSQSEKPMLLTQAYNPPSNPDVPSYWPAVNYQNNPPPPTTTPPSSAYIYYTQQHGGYPPQARYNHYYNPAPQAPVSSQQHGGYPPQARYNHYYNPVPQAPVSSQQHGGYPPQAQYNHYYNPAPQAPVSSQQHSGYPPQAQYNHYYNPASLVPVPS